MNESMSGEPTEGHDPAVLEKAHQILEACASPEEMGAAVQRAVERNAEWRGERCVNLLAPEAPTSPAVRALWSAEVGIRAAEGHIGPANRWFVGTRYIDELEALCVELLKRTFDAGYADHRLLSGMLGNLTVYSALTEPGDVIMSIPKPSGGHSSNRPDGPAGVRGLRVVDVPMDPQELEVDLDLFRETARLVRPKVVALGATMTLFPFPIREMAHVVAEWGGHIYFDGAHQQGLIAAGLFQDPLGEAEAAGRDQLAGAIADRLKEALAACCADDLFEDEREQLADGLGGSIVAQVPEGSGEGESGPEASATVEETAAVTVSASVFFTETVDPSSVTLSTRLVLVADFEAGYISGSLTGSGDEGTVVECRLDGGQGALIETSEWNGTHVYEAEFTDEFDPAAGTFSAPISIEGSTDWVQVTQFQDERCTHLNQGSSRDSWGGSGSVEGIVTSNGSVELTTSWQSSNRSVSGTFTGAGEVEGG